MPKLIFKLALLFIVYIAVMTLMSCCLDAFFTQNFKNEKPFWILNQYNNDFDFAVLGTSRVENLVDINTIEKLTGTKGINIGVQGTNHAGLYLILERFIRNNNKMRLLMMQVDEYALDSKNSYINPFQTYAYLPYMSDEHVSKIIKENTDISKFDMWKNIPFSRYIDYNSMYLSYCLNNLLKPDLKKHSLTKGSQLENGDSIFIFDKTKYKVKRREIDSKDVYYLFKILDLAKQNNIRVVLFTSPQYYEVLPYLNTRGDFLKLINNISTKLSIGYINYELDSMSNNSALFNDYSHLNSKGGIMFSEKLSQVVKASLSD